MFPDLDREVIDDVVREKEGRYDNSIVFIREVISVACTSMLTSHRPTGLVLPSMHVWP